jgi:hypothetical protein
MVAILHPTGPGQQIPIDRAVVLIGRSPECDVILDISTKISRMHCALVQVDADYYIRDLGSMNGITVAGRRVDKDVKLTNGVEVMIGDLKFLFLENVMPAAKQTRGAGVKGSPIFVDETIDVIDVDEVEVVDLPAPVRSVAKTSAAASGRPQRPHVPDADDDRTVRLRADDIAEVEIVDAEVIDVVELVDVVDVVDEVEVINDVEIIEDVIDVIEVVEEIEDVEILDVVDEVEVLDDVEIVDEPPRKNRPRPRLR